MIDPLSAYEKIRLLSLWQPHEKYAARGKHPASWKMDQNTPLFKKDDELSNANYRPAIHTGAPNDGFLQNTLRTLFKAIQSTFRSLEMHALWNYKICICSVILGELESFRNYY